MLGGKGGGFRICRHYTTFNENFGICGTLRG